MATMNKRTQVERRDEAERRLLEAGVSLVAELGLDGFTLGDVGTAAGYSRALPAHYFGSKQNFQERVIEYISVEFQEKRLIELGEPGLPALLELVRNCFENTKDGAVSTKILQIMLADPSGKLASMQEGLAAARARAYALYERRIREGIMNGSIRHDVEPALATRLVISMVCTSLRIAVADPAADSEAVGGQVAQFVAQGLGVIK